MVNFRDIAHKKLKLTVQHAFWYFMGRYDYPEMGKGLFVQGTTYFDWKLSPEDAKEFVSRVEGYRRTVLGMRS